MNSGCIIGIGLPNRPPILDFREPFVHEIGPRFPYRTQELTMKLVVQTQYSLRASSLGGGGREKERGESLQRCLRNFHFCVEFFDAKCRLVDIEFGAYVIALRVESD